jgi:diamine N-acetyltransferase
MAVSKRAERVFMSVTLRDVTKDNWKQVVDLKIMDEQKGFVAPNWYSILRAHFEFGHARVVYDADTPVGFVWYGKPPDDEHWWIIEFMIAKEYQGKGYGRTAMNLTIEEMRQNYACRDIYITIVPGNEVARKLYESMGFVDTGTIDEEDELVFLLDVAKG